MTHRVRRISDGANKEMQVLYLKSIRLRNVKESLPTSINDQQFLARNTYKSRLLRYQFISASAPILT
jgi:hypothetical protein